MACDDHAVLARQNRHGPAPLTDRCRYLSYLNIAVGTCVSGIGNEPLMGHRRLSAGHCGTTTPCIQFAHRKIRASAGFLRSRPYRTDPYPRSRAPHSITLSDSESVSPH